ncbi:hypothetical protein LN461_18685 [Xanthomonas arboricola]|uniref:hypothetical protein n=1 Tax=Xanthomonas arboricola TaxID=56448 RepID=UPI001E41498D|nr:hypothetical protein [Xanthomonas arboricola]MCC8671362.1 hypothetical protein [Xanthomonas arboricola]
MQARHAPGARCHANGHATVMGGTVQGNAVLGCLAVWHPGATIGADAQASTVFMRRPGAFGAVNIAGTTQVRGDIELRKGTTPTQGVFYGYADGAAMRDFEFGVELSQAVPEITARGMSHGWQKRLHVRNRLHTARSMQAI